MEGQRGWIVLALAIGTGYGLSYVPRTEFLFGFICGFIFTVVLALVISAKVQTNKPTTKAG